MRRVIGCAASTGLASAAALHIAWALGSTWPARDEQELADLVVGDNRGAMPPVAATVGVAGALGVASWAVCRQARGRGGRATRTIGLVASAALLARGGLGFFVFAHSTPEFARWNKRLYSPLCLALGAGAFAAAKEPR